MCVCVCVSVCLSVSVCVCVCVCVSGGVYVTDSLKIEIIYFTRFTDTRTESTDRQRDRRTDGRRYRQRTKLDKFIMLINQSVNQSTKSLIVALSN